MLQSLIPEERKKLEKELAGKTDSWIKAQAAKISAKLTGYTIQKREVISDDDVILHISESGRGHMTKIELKKFGSDWKLAGPGQDDSPPNKIE